MANPFITLAHAIDPSLWATDVLNLDLDSWQQQLVRSPPGSRTIALVHRQAGKTTGAAVAIGHTMLFEPDATTSLALAPTMRQSSELIRRLRAVLLTAGATLNVDNAFTLEISSGARCVAMPGENDAAIRGYAVNGVLVIDEAARVSDPLYDAARPMLIRHASTARLLVLSTAWARQGFFYKVWSEGSPEDWIKIEASIQTCRHLSPEAVEREKRSLSATVFRREYLNEFDAIERRFFDANSIDAAFGGVAGPTPEITDDPVRSRQPAFLMGGFP